MNAGPSWQWPHIPLFEFRNRKPHHDLRTADHNDGVMGIKARARNDRCHHADRPAPGRHRAVHRDVHAEVEPGAPSLQFLSEKDVLRRASAVHQDYAAVLLAIGQNGIEGRPQGRKANTSGDDYHVMAEGFFNRPGTSERTAQSEDRTCLQLPHGARYRADLADGMDQAVGPCGVAADGNRHFPDSEGVQHVELAWRELEILGAFRRPEVESKCVPRFASCSQDTAHAWRHRT
jgi:hypothetical protein